MTQPASLKADADLRHSLRGKVALVTGGGTGIGRATVLRLAGLGAHVFFSYSRSEREAMETAADASGLPGTVRAGRADVRDAAAVGALVSQAVAEYGRLDLLVNNAAVSPNVAAQGSQCLSDLDGFTDDIWETVLAVNVRGAFTCARIAALARPRPGGARLMRGARVSQNTLVGGARRRARTGQPARTSRRTNVARGRGSTRLQPRGAAWADRATRGRRWRPDGISYDHDEIRSCHFGPSRRLSPSRCRTRCLPNESTRRYPHDDGHGDGRRYRRSSRRHLDRW